MNESIYSPSWYRVSDLKPRLRSHIEIHRHHYRGQVWYILQDHSSGKYQRFTPIAHHVIGLMDGKRTLQEIWDIAKQKLGTETPSQEEVIRLLSQLHSVDAIQADVIPDTTELQKRYKKLKYGKWKQGLKSPLFIRLPIFDPEKYLNRFQWIAKPFFGWLGFILWVMVVGSALFMLGSHWPEITLNITDRVLAPSNLIILWFTFPVLKAFHEFGHAFAVKINGGEVHEMGIMLLVFAPVPYVDASASSAFRKKQKRILVGAAGMLVELFIAALAFFIWINVEPGPVRAVAYNVMFIAGVSSLLFNGNPLLRYDAYYILVDLIEIPNLGTRGNKYVLYLMQRFLLGADKVEPPLSTKGERIWFVVYTILAFFYRLFIFTAIVLFVASKFFFIGVIFACWAFANMFVFPAAKVLKFLALSPKLKRRRQRAIAVSALILLTGILLVTNVPVPLGTMAEGVVWTPERAFVRAATDGFVEELLAVPGARINAGDSLIKCSDPLLKTEIKVMESKLRELEAVYDKEYISDRVSADIIGEKKQQIKAELEDARQREKELIIRSANSGTLVIPMAEDLPGRFIKRGELLGYVLDRSSIIVRAVVFQQDVDLIRNRTRHVGVRFPENISQVMPAVFKREVPAATNQLPSKTLTQEGGGQIAVDPQDNTGVKAFQKVFLFDIELPDTTLPLNVGGRIYVRFDHGREPLIRRWYRSLRQLFLKKFNA